MKKAICFYEWFTGLKEFLENERNKLTEQVSFKLKEIIEFTEQYSCLESLEIPFVPQAEAQQKQRKNSLVIINHSK